MLPKSDPQLREYSRDVASYTLKQLVQWRSSLERLSNEQEKAQAEANGDLHHLKGAYYVFSESIQTENTS